MMNTMDRFASCRGRGREIDMLLELTKQVEGRTICAPGDATAWPIQGLVLHFRPEVEAGIAAFRRGQGAVLVGGRMKSEVDPTSAVPENLRTDR